MVVKELETIENLEPRSSIIIYQNKKGKTPRVHLLPKQRLDKWGAIVYDYTFRLPPSLTPNECEKLAKFFDYAFPSSSSPTWPLHKKVFFYLQGSNPRRRFTRAFQIWDFEKDLQVPEGAVQTTYVYPAYHAGMGIGFDPELFFTCRNHLVPAFEILPSLEKEFAEPSSFHFQDEVPGSEDFKTGSIEVGGPYYDGFAAEFQTTPYYCLAYAVDQIAFNLAYLYDVAKLKKCTLSIKDTMHIPNIHTYPYELKQLGCSPSFNAYDFATPPNLHCDIPLRSAGFHIHFGLDTVKLLDIEEVKRLIRVLDFYVAIPNMLMLQGLETTERRQMYGLPGEFRLPPHGLEYRVLSSATLYSPVLVHIAVEAGRGCINAAVRGKLDFLEKFLPPQQEVYRVLQTYDYDTAAQWLQNTTKVFRYIDATTTKLHALYNLKFKSTIPDWSLPKAWHFGKWRWHSNSSNCQISNCTYSPKAKTVTL